MSKITCFVTQRVKYNGSVSLHFSCLTGNLFHRFSEVIFNISCYSTCMLTYMTCYFRWTKLHVDQQAMLFFNISCYSTCMLFLTCHAIFRWTHPKYNGSVSLHFSCLTGNLFHRFAEVIFDISCYSTCMLMNPPTLKIAWHVKNNMHVY